MGRLEAGIEDKENRKRPGEDRLRTGRGANTRNRPGKVKQREVLWKKAHGKRENRMLSGNRSTTDCSC